MTLDDAMAILIAVNEFSNPMVIVDRKLKDEDWGCLMPRDVYDMAAMTVREHAISVARQRQGPGSRAEYPED